jgi:hypothetical protein
MAVGGDEAAAVTRTERERERERERVLKKERGEKVKSQR